MTKQTRLRKSEWLNWREVAKAIKVLRGERLIPTPRTLRQYRPDQLQEVVDVVMEQMALRHGSSRKRDFEVATLMLDALLAAEGPQHSICVRCKLPYLDGRICMASNYSLMCAEGSDPVVTRPREKGEKKDHGGTSLTAVEAVSVSASGQLSHDEPFRVELEKGGCERCGHGTQWTVVGPDDTAIGQSFEDEELAQDIAEYMNQGYRVGCGGE